MAASGDVAELALLIEATETAKRAVSEAVLEAVLSLLRSFSAWYAPREVGAAAARMVTAVEAGQRQVAGLTDAYLSRASSQIAGRSIAPVGAVNDVSQLRQGVTHRQVYERLSAQYRYEVSQGTAEPDILSHLENRARSMAGMDLALAEREQERKFTVVRKVDGWRRVIHPEAVSSRSKDGTPGELCGMCLAASDRVYATGTLKALHDGDRCTILPIINGQDPGAEVNRQDLDDLYAAAGGTAAAKLKRVKFVVHEHGELGAVLRAASDSFRGPDDVAKAARAA